MGNKFIDAARRELAHWIDTLHEQADLAQEALDTLEEYGQYHRDHDPKSTAFAGSLSATLMHIRHTGLKGPHIDDLNDKAREMVCPEEAPELSPVDRFMKVVFGE